MGCPSGLVGNLVILCSALACMGLGVVYASPLAVTTGPKDTVSAYDHALPMSDAPCSGCSSDCSMLLTECQCLSMGRIR